MKEWLKKNSTYIILAIVVIAAVSWISIRELYVARQNKKIAELEFNNSTLELANKNLNVQLGQLQIEYDSIKNTNDSLKVVLGNKQKELADLIEKHKKEIDSLINIPPDTIYKKLGVLYPNFDGSPLVYPFSSSQIVPIYKTTLSYGFLLDEYRIQGGALKTCLGLNTGYETGIINLNKQISNLYLQIGNYNSQISNYEKEITLINRKVGRRGFWNGLLITTTAIATGIAILK